MDELLKRAATNDAEAQYELALRSICGGHLPMSEAFKWLDRSSHNGCSSAQELLGTVQQVLDDWLRLPTDGEALRS